MTAADSARRPPPQHTTAFLFAVLTRHGGTQQPGPYVVCWYRLLGTNGLNTHTLQRTYPFGVSALLNWRMVLVDTHHLSAPGLDET